VSTKSPPEVVLVAPVPPPRGGMADQAQALVEKLRQSGIHVQVVPVNSPYKPYWITHFKGVRAVFRLGYYMAQVWRALKGANLVHVFANSGWSWHLFAAPAIWIAVLRRLPILVHYHGGAAESFLEKSWFWIAPTLKRADELIVPSEFLEKIFDAHGIDTKVIPNFVDLSCFSPRNSALREGEKKSEWPHLVVTRNLEYVYGIDTAIRAFARLRKEFPHARLTIAGSGSEKEKLEKLARELNVSSFVSFTGTLERKEIAALYKTAQIAINPSRTDNMPISILEAMATGIPVVSTRVGGIPCLIKEEVNGLLVPVDDDVSLAQAVSRLLTDNTLYRNVIENGLQGIKEYSWCSVREKWLDAYFSINKMDKK